MAFIIGLATDAEIAELERRGWEIESVPDGFLQEHEPPLDQAPDEGDRWIQVWVDNSVFSVMDGPDWEKGHETKVCPHHH